MRLLINLIRGAGLSLVYLLPFSARMKTHVTSTPQPIFHDWQRVSLDLHAAFAAYKQPSNERNHHEAT